MEVLNWGSIGGIIVDVILFFIIAGNAVIGYKKGLTRVIFSICSGFVAVVLVLILYKPVTNYIFNQTQLAEKIESIVESKIGYLLGENSIQTIQELEENNKMQNTLTIFLGNEIGDLLQETTDNIIKYVSNRITQKVISVIVFFALFAIIRLILHVFEGYVEWVALLPIVRVFNGSGGMIYGIIKGFLIIYAIFAIISIMMPIVNNTGIILAIENAKIGGKMFNNNIILNLIFRFI